MSRTNPRSPAKLSAGVDRHLRAYAVAATAAGIGALAGTQQAEARVIYTPANQPINSNATFKLDLNNDGIADFTFTNIYTSTIIIPQTGSTSIVNAYLELGGAQASNQAIVNGKKFCAAIPAAKKVDGAGHFGTRASSVMEACHKEIGLSFEGPWDNVKNRYLGLKFLINGKVHYGWARLDVSLSRCAINATLTGYAYETIPNKPITTGQTHDDLSADSSEAKTAPALSLGNLARGAAAPTVRRNDSLANGK